MYQTAPHAPAHAQVTTPMCVPSASPERARVWHEFKSVRRPRALAWRRGSTRCPGGEAGWPSRCHPLMGRGGGGGADVCARRARHHQGLSEG